MATETDDISRVYAQTLADIAKAKGGDAALNGVADELESLVELVRNDRKFGEFLASPIIDTNERESALRRILEGRASDLLLRFVLLLNRKGRLGHLARIADAFDQTMQAAFGKVEVDVFTVDGAAPEAEAQATLASQLKKTLGREPVFHFYADKNMIGGVKLRIGDQLVDGSVATRLRRLRTTLIEQGGDQVRTDPNRFLA